MQQQVITPALTRKTIAALNPSDLLVELARRGVKVEDATGVLKGKAECPHCGHKGPIEKDFGVRIMRGHVWPQSWCKGCRAGKETDRKKKQHRH